MKLQGFPGFGLSWQLWETMKLSGPKVNISLNKASKLEKYQEPEETGKELRDFALSIDLLFSSSIPGYKFTR